MILFASDLDNTLLYSYRKIVGNSICVETRAQKELSYMTAPAYALLQKIAKKALFVPITTRSVEQYQRISLLETGFPQYALVSNGGNLLVENEIDRQWFAEIKSFLNFVEKEVKKAFLVLEDDKGIYLEPRFVDDIFVFAKTHTVSLSIERMKNALDTDKVYIDNNGDKLYVFPKMLDKGMALERLKKRVQPDITIAAGDSAFDIPMLLTADIAIIPKDSNSLTEALKEKEGVVKIENEACLFAENMLREVWKRINEEEKKA